MTSVRLLRHSARMLAVCISLLLSACANISGLGGSAEYGCKAPQGVQCDSVSGNYYNAIQNNLPSQRQHRPTGTAITSSATGSQAVTVRTASAAGATQIIGKPGLDDASPQALTASPLRSQTRVLRLWFKPWEDADHDLYDQGFVYVQIDSGRWLIDHAQQRIRDAYAPIRPPRASSLPASAPAAQPATVPGKPTDPRFFGAGAPDGNSGPMPAPFSAPSKPLPGAIDLPADDSQ